MHDMDNALKQINRIRNGKQEINRIHMKGVRFKLRLPMKGEN